MIVGSCRSHFARSHLMSLWRRFECDIIGKQECDIFFQSHVPKTNTMTSILHLDHRPLTNTMTDPEVNIPYVTPHSMQGNTEWTTVKYAPCRQFCPHFHGPLISFCSQNMEYLKTQI